MHVHPIPVRHPVPVNTSTEQISLRETTAANRPSVELLGVSSDQQN
jgi:hypothetical protein